MRELSLFSGAGGGLLATKHLLGMETIGYVEWDEYCQKILKQRIEDGFLDRAPTFGDIHGFIKRGAAAEYRGFADLVTAGFPCQPFSLAGKRLGPDDPRNQWPATAETIRIVRPTCVFLENNPGIEKYLPVVFGDLRRAGYCVHPPLYAAAASLGAGHLRWRVWIYAHAHGAWEQQPERPQQEVRGRPRGDCPEALRSDTLGQGFTDFARGQAVTDIARNASARTRDWSARRLPAWRVEPALVRVVHGLPYRMDRTRALGQAQLPIVAATAWRILTEGIRSDL